MDELVSFCYLQFALSARKINLFDLILMCNFSPFEHSCLLGLSRVCVLSIRPEFFCKLVYKRKFLMSKRLSGYVIYVSKPYLHSKPSLGL